MSRPKTKRVDYGFERTKQNYDHLLQPCHPTTHNGASYIHHLRLQPTALASEHVFR